MKPAGGKMEVGQAQCAHLKVEYRPDEHANGTKSDRWRCLFCGGDFWPQYWMFPAPWNRPAASPDALRVRGVLDLALQAGTTRYRHSQGEPNPSFPDDWQKPALPFEVFFTMPQWYAVLAARAASSGASDETLTICHKLDAVAEHLNLKGRPQSTDILTAVKLVEEAVAGVILAAEQRGVEKGLERGLDLAAREADAWAEAGGHVGKAGDAIRALAHPASAAGEEK